MKFRRNTDTKPVEETKNIVYAEVGDETDMQPTQRKTLRLNRVKKEENTVEKTAEVENKEEKPVENKVSIEDSIKDWTTTDKILPKFVNKSPKASYGSAIEFSKSAFNLAKRNDKGYRESLDGKLLMNFWTFDQKTNKQLNLIPAYIDISEWLNVCHMILSGRLHDMTDEARAKQISGGYKYCSYIYQNNGGSYKPIFKINGKQYGGDVKQPIATLFKITPAGDARTKDKWTLSAEIYKGTTGDTGLIEPLKNETALAKVTVLFTYNDLVRVARMSEMVIQAHMTRI